MIPPPPQSSYRNHLEFFYEKDLYSHVSSEIILKKIGQRENYGQQMCRHEEEVLKTTKEKGSEK